MTIDCKKLLASFVTLPIAVSALQASAEEKRPNILLFMVDDMGWQDTSVPFADSITANNRKYLTPAMERLAASGMKFTSAYASAISSPSRCSLITGANAVRHKVTNWTLHRDQMTDEHSDIAVPPADWNFNGISCVPGINNTYVGPSFVQRLKDAGYHTIHCGKAHFGAIDTPSADPAVFGFEVNICGHAGGGLASYLGEQRYGHDSEGRPVSPFAVPGLEAYWDSDVFATEALTLEALKALQSADSLRHGQPFFLYMSHYAVHVPIQADRRFLQHYLDAGLDDTEAAYATLVEGMDKSLGDLMDYLESSGQLSNTIIIFMSDNGGLSALGRTPPLHVQNAPLRSGKGSAYEGGVREPMIVYWPGVTEPGSTIADYLIIEDFFPTILDMAGVTDRATVQTVDGRSFVPMLIGGDAELVGDRSIYWNTPNTWIAGDYRAHGIGQTCAIRRGNYKLIYWYIDGRKELYDLSEDIGETRDLAEAMPELVDSLSADLGRFLRSADAQRPTVKYTGQPCRWPDE